MSIRNFNLQVASRRVAAPLSVALLSVALAAIAVPHATAAEPPRPAHLVRPVAQGNFPRRVHVFEDFETEIERRWWLRGELETMDVAKLASPAIPNLRACRAAETLNFDRKMGDRTNKVKGVVFNPVPGPPMSGHTRLSFRYRIQGSDEIRVQIYSLTRNYHRYLLLADLPQQSWQTATVDMTRARRPDGSGGALSEDERIDDIQFYVSPDAQLLIDDIVLFEAAAEDEKRPFPRRVIFTGWFDTGKQGVEWPGDFEIVAHEKPLTWDAARSVINAESGEPWLRVGLRGRRQLSPRTSIDFQYRLSRGSALRVVLADSQTGREFAGHVDAPKSGDWQRATLNSNADPNEGDRFADEIRFHIEPGTELQIDDLLIFAPGD